MNLQDIDKELLAIEAVLYNFDIITPNNVDEELDKFLKDKNYSPQLKYDYFDSEPYIKRLEAIKIPLNSPIAKLLEEKQKYLIKQAINLKNLGTDKFSTLKFHGEVSDELFNHAKKILESPEPVLDEKEKTLSDKDLAKCLKERMDSYRLTGWDIRFKDNASSTVSINPAGKIITIRKNEMFSVKHKDKLLIHEIDTHILRSANGALQDYKIFSAGVQGYISTEEGLASYNEGTQGVNNPKVIRNLALRVISTKIASIAGFKEVFEATRPYHDDDETAFKSVIRTKRGMGDTSKPGGLLKDHAYLKGLLLIEKYVSEGGDLRLLYAGKIRIQDVHLVKEGVIKPAKILPEFLK